MPVCAQCGETNPARARYCMACAAALPLPPGGTGEIRKTVTVLFCDVVGSTPLGEQLEPESVHGLMTRFFEEMRAVLERHGGTVEKYIGDAVVAVFGAPTLHEDDALRAVRAAAEMREALSSLNEELERSWGVALRTRIGINTGEVVTAGPGAGGPGGAGGVGPLVVSDAVNVAARLEQAAAPGEILLGPETYALVRASAAVDEGRALSMKGKSSPVTGYRLLTVAPSPEPVPRSTPAFVGRTAEVLMLREAFDRSWREKACVLVTILGVAGVGKSRLASEFADALGAGARVLRGRCLPYGEGITFWPVAELVKDACGIVPEDRRDDALPRIEAVVSDADGAGLIAERVAAVAGFAESSGGMQETYWSIRRFLECLAAERPLVVVFDDIQWAEPAFLDLVEYLGGWIRDAPILLLCLARQDLLDERPGWGSGAGGSPLLLLPPLDEHETEELIQDLLGASPLQPADRSRIVEAAEGNPLFVEEMLRMLEDEGLLARDGDTWVVTGDLSGVAVPATIQVVLAARLDRLGAEEKTLLGTAAVIGKEFWWGAVADLVPEALAPRVGGHLQTLVRKGLILPERSALAGEDAFRFHHILVQEAAYQGLPKGRRAELHERFAGWIEERAGDRAVEYEEVVGYHLEQAHRYRLELGAPDERSDRLGARAGERLASAGRRALARGDMAAGANLLDRAASSMSEEPRRLALLPDLGEALSETGDLVRAADILDQAIRGAASIGDRGLAGHATIAQLLLQESTDPQGRSEVALRELERVIPVFEELGDDLGLARAWRLAADVRWTQARYAAVDEALEHAIDRARAAGANWVEAESLGLYTGSGVYGALPAPDVVTRCERVLGAAQGNRLVEALAMRSLAAARAMQGRPEEAREHVAQAVAILEDLGLWLRASFVAETRAFVERLAGDPDAAERALRAGYDVSQKIGELGFQSTVAALLAKAMVERGRLDEADVFLAASADAAAEDDRTTQVLLHAARGRALAARGHAADAESSCARAVALAEETDDVNMRGDTLVDLAEVLALAGRRPEAVDAFERAAALFGGKANVAALADAQTRLRSIRG